MNTNSIVKIKIKIKVSKESFLLMDHLTHGVMQDINKIM